MIGRIIFAALAISLGLALFRDFDSEAMRFKNIGLAIMYMLAFAVFTFLAVRSNKSTEHIDK